MIEKGLGASDDPVQHLAVFTEAVARLGERVRRIVEWYTVYEDFHVQYKHGLKLAMRPYGNPTPEAIEKRRTDVSGALIAFTAEPISQMLKGPAQQQAMIFPNLVPEAQSHLNALVEAREMLRYKMSGPEVNLDDVVEVSGTVAQLLTIAAANRTSVSDGLDEHGSYKFKLPGERRYEIVNVVLQLSSAPTLSEFSS